MKGLDILLWVVGVAAAGYAIYEIMLFATAKDPVTGHQNLAAGLSHLYIGIAAAVVAAICIVWAFVRRPHEVEEIHVTK